MQNVQPLAARDLITCRVMYAIRRPSVAQISVATIVTLKEFSSVLV